MYVVRVAERVYGGVDPISVAQAAAALERQLQDGAAHAPKAGRKWQATVIGGAVVLILNCHNKGKQMDGTELVLVTGAELKGLGGNPLTRRVA